MPRNNQTSNSRRGIVKSGIVVACLLFASLIAGTFYMRGPGAETGTAAEGAITFEVFAGEFISSVNEVGDIESSSNVEIRSNVRSRGRAGSTIIELIPEGTRVREGDFLCQLDDSLLRDELTERKIKVAKDRALVIQAESILESAKQKLEEFEEGSFQQEQAELLAAIGVAQETEKRASEVRKHSETLNRKGYVSETQLAADKFAEQKAKLDLKLSQDRLKVFEKFTKKRMLAELKADVRKQEADLEASQYTLQLSEQRQQEYAQQVVNCRILAPSDGTLVYANESERSSNSVVIEEGASIRDSQPIFYLPDPQRMQVKAKVNDSKINKVKVDQSVQIRVDTDPENPIAGRVTRVSAYPNPRRYYQAPIEYDVFIEITEQSPLVRTGLRAKVEIFVERLDNVVQVPVSSLVQNNDAYSVIVKSESGLKLNPVKIGANNESFVVIKAGVETGEEVLVDADNYRDVLH